MSLRALVAALFLVASAVGATACSKKKDAAPAESAPIGAAPTTAGAAGAAPSADGVRKVPIDVVEAGYSPERISGKPGEKLNLVFTRKVDGHCYEELKTPDGKLVALPKNKAVEIPVTVPQDGEVKFACGMGMLEGVIVADKTKS
jgi:plastocyanin domain-containing protein